MQYNYLEQVFVYFGNHHTLYNALKWYQPYWYYMYTLNIVIRCRIVVKMSGTHKEWIIHLAEFNFAQHILITLSFINRVFLLSKAKWHWLLFLSSQRLTTLTRYLDIIQPFSLFWCSRGPCRYQNVSRLALLSSKIIKVGPEHLKLGKVKQVRHWSAAYFQLHAKGIDLQSGWRKCDI